MASRGRPRVLDEEKRKLLCDLVSIGCGKRQAARQVGVSATTLFKALREDPQFAEQMRAARTSSRVSMLQNMVRHCATSWPARNWLLAQGRPSRRRPRQRRRESLDTMRATMIDMTQKSLQGADEEYRARLSQRLDEILEMFDRLEEGF